MTEVRTRSRIGGLDAARGVAVIAMIYVHLVPADGGVGISKVFTTLVTLFEGKFAALFFVVAGVASALQVKRQVDTKTLCKQLFRRYGLLAIVGVVMHRLVWSTEVLLALALIIPITSLVARRGSASLLVTIFAMVISIPFISLQLSSWFEADWLNSGSHAGDGFNCIATLRMLTINGSYPVVPWLALSCTGAYLYSFDLNDKLTRFRTLCCAALAVAIGCGAVMCAERVALPLNLARLLQCTWTPTSLPFLLINGGIATIMLVSLWHLTMERWPARMLAQCGKASLTHYMLHILVIALLLRHYYPDESWGANVGILAYVIYIVTGLWLTSIWFRRFNEGPLEILWRWASGPKRKSVPKGSSG